MSEANNSSGNILHWQTPTMSSLTGRAMSASEQEAIDKANEEKRKKLAYDLGFELGKKEALQSVQQDMLEKISQLDQLNNAIRTPFSDLSHQVTEELATLAGAIARQLVRRELKTDPEAILGVVRETVSSLAINAEEIRVHLNPEDAQLLRELTQLSDGDNNWLVVEDPTLMRGDCKVTTQDSFINASLEARVAAIVAGIHGGERGTDRI